MSVNVTSREFAQPDLASEIHESLEQTGIDPSCLQLEIVETIAMGDAEQSGHMLSQLKALGVRLSIDDFGTGYSSLSRLRRIPVDTLKNRPYLHFPRGQRLGKPRDRAEHHYACPQSRVEGRRRRGRDGRARNFPQAAQLRDGTGILFLPTRRRPGYVETIGKQP
jgi:EAL domain